MPHNNHHDKIKDDAMQSDQDHILLLISAILYFAMDGMGKAAFFHQHIQQKITIPFVYNQWQEQYFHVADTDQHYGLANFTLLMSFVFNEYKSMLLDTEQDIILQAVASFEHAMNQYVFDDHNTIDDAYIVDDKGYFLDIQYQAKMFLAHINSNISTPEILDIQNIIGIYNHIPTPTAWQVL